MKVSAETVHQMARLARLRVPATREEGLANELSAILDHVHAITAWTVSDLDSSGSESTPRRADVPQGGAGSGLIEGASRHEGGEVLVPPIKGAS